LCKHKAAVLQYMHYTYE